MMTNPQNPTQTNAYYHAASAYSNTQAGTMSGFEVVAELYKGMIKFVGQAKKSYQGGQLDDMCHYIQKTNKILMALQSHLDFEQGGEAAVFLNDFYTGMFSKLFKVLRADDPAAEFDEVHKMLLPVKDIWVAHAANSRKDDPEDHIALPSSAQAPQQKSE